MIGFYRVGQAVAILFCRICVGDCVLFLFFCCFFLYFFLFFLSFSFLFLFFLFAAGDRRDLQGRQRSGTAREEDNAPDRQIVGFTGFYWVLLGFTGF